jgi:hypothetical protein
MSDVKYTVGVDTSAGVAGLEKFNRGVGSLEGSLRTLGGGGSLGRLSNTLLGLGGAAGLGALIGRGIRFNQTLGDSEAAVAQVLAQFQGLNAESAKNEAAKAMQRIVELEPQVAGGLSDLTSGFLATLAASQSAGISVEQNIDLVGKFANALANANIPADQLAQEMRSILTGNIGADSTLAKVLGLTNEDVKRAAAGGQLAQFLSDKLGKLGSAGDTASVAFSTLNSAVDKTAGALAAGLFDDAVAGAKSLAVELEANRDLFVSLGRGIATASSAGLTFAGWTKDVADGLGVIAAGVALSFSEGPIDGFSLALDAAAANMVEAETQAKTLGAAVETAMKPAAAEADKLAQAMAKVDAAAKQVAGAGAGAAGGAGADADGDGIVSKREQRRADIDQKRRERKANAVGREGASAREGRELAGASGLDEFFANQNVQLTGPNEGQRTFGRGPGQITGRQAAARVDALTLPGEGTGFNDRQTQFNRLNDVLAPPAPAAGAGGPASTQAMTNTEMINRLDAVIAELKVLNGAGA